MNKQYDAIALFSGGLDSILAVKIIEEQGLNVKCLHFMTPFFGKEQELEKWRKLYGVDVQGVDIGAEFSQMLVSRPNHGFGKWLNPCVDCKILMMQKVHEFIHRYNVTCVVSGEVLGQRPMSQRRDTLNVIRRQSGLEDMLLRPLSALLMQPSRAELSGLVDRGRLKGISGRGRKEQLKLAKYYGIDPIPTPAGGCRLTEQENASRYAKALIYLGNPDDKDFALAHTGRQYWSYGDDGMYWLCIGRDAKSNAELEVLREPSDIIFKLKDFPGPLAIGRQVQPWNMEIMADGASFVASFAPRAVQSCASVIVIASQGDKTHEFEVMPSRETKQAWSEPTWDEVKDELKGL